MRSYMVLSDFNPLAWGDASLCVAHSIASTCKYLQHTKLFERLALADVVRCTGMKSVCTNRSV